MTIRRLLQIYSLLLTVILVEIGCDRTPQPSIQQKEPAEVAELIELSMEALIDRMVTMEKETREKKSKSGGSHAGLIDGKLWYTTPEEMRIAYMRGIADFASSLYGVMVADMVERENLITTKALDFLTRPEPIDTRSVLANRMSEVVSSGSISDLVDAAVQDFIRINPL